MKFELLLPGMTYFGNGEIARIGSLAVSLGRRALLVTGWGSLEGSGRFNGILRNFEAHGVSVERFRLEREPSVAEVTAAATMARSSKCDMVVSVGGGSAIDLGKAAAMMARNSGNIRDYLEGVGKGMVMAFPPLPIVAVPTTAGTGSEATRNAVIGSAKDGFKKSLRDIRLMPRMALVDPELTSSCPSDVTAATGMDALTQLLEALTSRNATTPISALALSGLSHAARGLPRAVAKGDDLDARRCMSYAAYLSGVALSHAGLGAVHALASPLGGLFGVPHTIACAILLPVVTKANLSGLETGRGTATGLESYRRAGEAMGESIVDFCAHFHFPRLSAYNITPEDLEKIVDGASPGSLKTNPVELTRSELVGILHEVI